MLVLKGTTEIIENVKNGEIINKGCPECQQDLLLKQFRVWDTLFLIPIIPSRETRFVYECVRCYETFDPAYRNTFINRAKYLNATPQEVKDLTDAFSLTILSAILTCDDRSTENVVDILKNFARNCGIDLENHKEKVTTEFLSQEELSKTVLEWYDIFRDCFSEENRDKALHQTLEYCNIIDLTVKETKLLYIFSRHWGLTKVQFEELHKGKI
ncbi:hypothetical protein [Chitinophaga filiformis]|uniref:Zinc-ribbon 15 domain-containing protein n=1 Tax=Chitinophaga filiformis TaxID=104663 RepID=A0A1G8BTC4_CHIFI|nr:hypothetical protein [Chitinophaga filiformis]SDH36412.1 hypothetical protein SAMN04488121_111151 [Chitinophaga filiformis]